MRLDRGRLASLAAGAVGFVLLATLDTPLRHDPVFGQRPALAAAVGVLMAVWWLTEALPIHVTACVPLVLFPALGVFGPELGPNVLATVQPYVDPYIFLFAGGMCIAAAMQQWNLHRRIALGIMRLIGSDPGRLLFGMLAATAFISLWISNTATATMMVPIGLALIAQLERQLGVPRLRHYGAAIMLAVAYGANLGGIGTKIGTAPNAQFSGFMAQLGVEISFLQFMAVGLPFVVLFLPLAWLVLWRGARAEAFGEEAGAAVVAREMAKLGPMSRAERIVLAVFLATAALWISGKWLTALLQPHVKSFSLGSAHVEAGIALLAAFVLLIGRTGGRAVLELRSLRAVPWETLLLLGGSFALAEGIQKSGLSDWMAQQMLAVRDLSAATQLLLASTVTVAVSAVASNTATIGVMLNVLKDAVPAARLTSVLFAATIAASCDFALPAGTPPNAIVFGSGYVTIRRMAKTGVVLDLAAAILAAVWCGLAVPWVL
jgi:sodium-dependent dicarboxylate transporter 2/3/5